ncbi:MAG: hypothetical protein HC806_05145 [Anaerolineae bacterium]|nr:hypothetical protein [Anaerolineae bacterium]
MDLVDMVYLQWSPQLAVTDASRETLQFEAARLLDNFIEPFAIVNNLPVVLAIGYPSADGAMTGCLPGLEGGACHSVPFLSRMEGMQA